MAIILRNKSGKKRRFGTTQFRYGVIYITITFLFLLVLNLYCSEATQKIFYKNKKAAMVEKAHLAASEISSLEALTPATVSQTVELMNGLKVSRMIVVDQAGAVLYDSHNATSEAQYALLPHIVQAMDGNDVFAWHYHDGVMRSEVATPVISYGIIIGCVYMMEYDTDQGALVASLQRNILNITIVLEGIVIVFTVIFAKAFSRRFKKIMVSMRTIQGGDYSHRLTMRGYDELSVLAEEFNDLTQRLETSEKKRQQFVSDASHELKTPLASIKLLSDSILQNDMDMDTVREFVGDIGEEAERLNRMSQKLLDLTRGESDVQEDSQTIINILPTAERVVRMLSTQAKEMDVDILMDVQQDVPILIREDDLYQILFNLVENGIKYNVRGGSVTISLSKDGDDSILTVSDTGVGIPEEALSHIFERFYRVDKARARASGGSGLGLSIVRNMVQRYQGKIQVNSEPGNGTTFTLAFPGFETEENSI